MYNSGSIEMLTIIIKVESINGDIYLKIVEKADFIFPFIIFYFLIPTKAQSSGDELGVNRL